MLPPSPRTTNDPQMESHSRTELQSLAKQHGIKANQKNEDIVAQLRVKGLQVESKKGLSVRDENGGGGEVKGGKKVAGSKKTEPVAADVVRDERVKKSETKTVQDGNLMGVSRSEKKLMAVAQDENVAPKSEVVLVGGHDENKVPRSTRKTIAVQGEIDMTMAEGRDENLNVPRSTRKTISVQGETDRMMVEGRDENLKVPRSTRKSTLGRDENVLESGRKSLLGQDENVKVPRSTRRSITALSEIVVSIAEPVKAIVKKTKPSIKARMQQMDAEDDDNAIKTKSHETIVVQTQQTKSIDEKSKVEDEINSISLVALPKVEKEVIKVKTTTTPIRVKKQRDMVSQVLARPPVQVEVMDRAELEILKRKVDGALTALDKVHDLLMEQKRLRRALEASRDENKRLRAEFETQQIE